MDNENCVSTSTLRLSNDDDVATDEVDRQSTIYPESLTLKMLLVYGCECCFALAVIFTVYAALQSSPLKMKIASHPEPFFPRHSPVIDYYWGNVQRAFDRMQDSDISFTLYYAPWDATSQHVRLEFEMTAKYYSDQVFFVAINCWWPEGECRRRFTKIQSFPVLIAYRNSGKGIQFHGPFQAPHLVAFLRRLINPLEVVHTRLDILRLQSRHTAVVIGFFDFNESPQPPGYLSYYVSALKALEKDVTKDIAFAVISNLNSALKFGMNSTGTIHLHMWNNTQAFTATRLSSQQLIQWIMERNHMIVGRLSPPGVKSQMLSEVLENSPTIVMMTPQFVTSSLLESPFNYLFKEIALDYFNCNSSINIEGIVQVTRMQVRDLKLKRHSLDQDSLINCNQQETRQIPINRCCQTLSDRLIGICEICLKNCLADFKIQQSRYLHLGCISKIRDYDSGRIYSECCFNKPEIKLTVAEERHCLLTDHPRVAKHLHFPPEKFAFKKSVNFTGLGCRTNKTLTFATMDSMSHGIFFERLGVNLDLTPSGTAVAIIDNSEESCYLLDQVPTLTTLRTFISNFTSGSLSRYLRSAPPMSLKPSIPDPSNEIEILEVTSSNFQMIFKDHKDVVLLIQMPSCAFCIGIAHIYLTVARYFQDDDDIVFTRINGDLNDLPWQFTVSKYPTILFFPGNGNLESHDYPDDLPITVSNLIHFVLKHAKLELKVSMALNVCTSGCVDYNRRSALDKIRDLLRRYRVLDGRLKSSMHLLLRNRLVNDNLTTNYYGYAELIVREMCSIKVQLAHARTLHLVLSTSENGKSLTRRQLDELTRSHGIFRKELQATTFECKSLQGKLDRLRSEPTL